METKKFDKYDYTSSTISPLDAYEVITKFMDNLTFEEKFIILRFFDKLVDSSGYQYKCKQNLSSVHMRSKNLFTKRKKIYSGSAAVTILDSCILVPVKKGSNLSWNFVLNGETMLEGLSPDTAFKIVKDVNTAFQILDKLKNSENNDKLGSEGESDLKNESDSDKN